MSELKEDIKKCDDIKAQDNKVEDRQNLYVNEEICTNSSNELDDNSSNTSNDDEITKLKESLKDSEEKYLRVHADFDNIKKRLEKEKYKAIDYASEKFAKDLLASIDSLEIAISSSNNDELDSNELLNKLKEGLDLTLKNFKTVFEKHDISVVETDISFYPEFHEAIMQVEDESKKDGDIVQVMQKGYTLKDRLLRPAMVSICKKS